MEEVDELFWQVRTAHRLLVAYYQRLHPIIDDLATFADTVFDFWTPQLFDKPARANPFTKWQWDLLPAAVTRYVFKQVKESSKVTKGDFTLEFLVVNDTGIVKEKGKGELDALALPLNVEHAESIIKVGIYRAAENSDKDYFSQWNSVNYPDYQDDDSFKRDKLFLTTGFEFPISLLLTEDGVQAVKEKIDKYLKITQQAISSSQS
ncbi:hypothetical protein [Vibrio salinus]|uniref:hypothetical protein n=1 Tax=Vibrio salinus TaxID=2899784 RepID=UPI001E4EE0B5|nr:hypothetical protein [Vibrio salinus]MCE0493119.1 hypothetical protein [Vibrio salinus]